MHSPCAHCLALIESELLSEPHLLMDKVSGALQNEIYRCRLCFTRFEFTPVDIYLLKPDTTVSVDAGDQNKTA